MDSSSNEEEFGANQERWCWCNNVQHGELASGLVGDGRMAEPEDIFDFVVSHFDKLKDFDKKRVLITAGPTYESIDPVRFIGNFSSGKMGFAIAEEFAERGALVTVVSGPTTIAIPKITKYRSNKS